VSVSPGTGPEVGRDAVFAARFRRGASQRLPGVERWPRKVWVGVGIVGAFVLVALLAPVLAPYDPLAQDPVNSLASPSSEHLLGTDEVGRDVLSRLIYATRVDLPVGLLAAVLPFLVGTVIGTAAGFLGGWVDAVAMRTSDVIQAFPSYILVIALVFALGPGAGSILIAFTVLGWVVYARIIRTEVLRVRHADYVKAARVSGLPTGRILVRDVFRNAVGPSLVFLPSDIVFATLALAAFSFLGLGIPPPTAEWGSMIADGQAYIRDQWWLATVPGLVMIALGLGYSLMGEGLEEAMNR
jgi:peptide/nickel transport system permease protein